MPIPRSYPFLMKNSVGHFHVSGQPSHIHSACLLCKHGGQLHLSVHVLIYLRFQFSSQPSSIFLLVRRLLQMYLSLPVSCYQFPFFLHVTPWCCLSHSLHSVTKLGHLLAAPSLILSVRSTVSCCRQASVVLVVLLSSVRNERRGGGWGGGDKGITFLVSVPRCESVIRGYEGCSVGCVCPVRTIVRTCSADLSRPLRETV